MEHMVTREGLSEPDAVWFSKMLRDMKKVEEKNS